jgi:hypothetical protein
MRPNLPRSPHALPESGGRSLLHPGPDVMPLRRDWMVRAVLIMAAMLVALAVLGVWLNHRPLPFDVQRWGESGGDGRGRMLQSLLAQTGFAGFSRAEVEGYIGPADFEERQFWFDLGPADVSTPLEPRARVGDTARLYGVFSHDRDGAITEVLFSRRRPLLGSSLFDSTLWFGSMRSERREMYTRTLGRLRALGLTRSTVESFLGPADGHRVRAHYSVGNSNFVLGSDRSLILEYDQQEMVSLMKVSD